MHKLLVSSILGLLSLASTVAHAADCKARLLAISGNTLTAYQMTGSTILWSAATGMTTPSDVLVVPDGEQAVVLVRSQSKLAAFDAATGEPLYTINGTGSIDVAAEHGISLDVHNQLYTNTLTFPYGPPRAATPSAEPDASPVGAPLIAVTDRSSNSSTASLIDSRSGQVHWTMSLPSDTYITAFMPRTASGYDLLSRSESNTGSSRIDGEYQDIRWTVPQPYRSFFPIPDINGDGRCDIFTRGNYSQTMTWLDGLTGEQLALHNYGAFDVLGVAVVPSEDGCGADVICAAQGSSGGGLRRMSACAPPVTVEWTCPSAYNNQTILGLIRRAGGGGGWTLISGWRHQFKAIAVDAATGQVLWSNVPITNADADVIGAIDLTGDGNDDVYAISNGLIRLYNGLTGIPVPGVRALPGTAAAAWIPSGSPKGDLNGDGIVNVYDLLELIGGWGSLCP